MNRSISLPNLTRRNKKKQQAPPRRYPTSAKYYDFTNLIREICFILKEIKPVYMNKHWQWYRSAIAILWGDQRNSEQSLRIKAISELLKYNKILTESAMTLEIAEHIVRFHENIHRKIEKNEFYDSQGFKLLSELMLEQRFWLMDNFSRISFATNVVSRRMPRSKAKSAGSGVIATRSPPSRQ